MDRPLPWMIATLVGVACAANPSPDAAAPPKVQGAANDVDAALGVRPPLRSQAQLEAWLAARAGKPTPLDRLSAGARERFLLALRWGSSGLGGLDPIDIEEELGDDELRTLLALFDQGQLARAIIDRRARRGDAPPTRPTWPADAPSPFERRYNRFYRANRGTSPAADPDAAALEARFDAAFPEARDGHALRQLAPHDLRLLGRAVEDVATSAARPGDVDTMQRLLAERERRGIARLDDVMALQRVLLVDRRFDAARALGLTHPDSRIAALPAFVDTLATTAPVQPTVWRMAPDGGTLVRTAVDLGPTQILVTAGCHFSRDAAEDISSDPVLGPAFARHARWLMSPPGVEDIAKVAEWNARFPRAQASMIHAGDEWSLLPAWRQPTFYIVRDGRVVEAIRGWPRDPATSRQPLIDALARAGLLDAGGEARRVR